MPSRPLPDLGGTYYSVVHGQWEGLPSNNVLTFTADPPPAPGATDITYATDVAVAVAAHWPALANVAFHTSYSGQEVKVYPLHTPIHPAIVRPVAGGGGMSGAIAGGMVAAVVAHDVLRRGRGSQSRTYFSPMDVTGIDATGKQISVAHQNSLQTAWNNFITAVLGDLLAAHPAVAFGYAQLSKGTTSGTPPVTTPPATYQITSSRVELLLSTQRRRMRRNS